MASIRYTPLLASYGLALRGTRLAIGGIAKPIGWWAEDDGATSPGSSKEEFMVKRFAMFVMLGVLALGALAACGGGEEENGGGGGNGEATHVSMTEMAFDPATITVPAGQEVTIEAENVGTVVHDFVIDDVNGQQFKLEAQPGETAEGSFTAPSSPTTLTFYCSQPGHRQAGMEGTLTVQ